MSNGGGDGTKLLAFTQRPSLSEKLVLEQNNSEACQMRGASPLMLAEKLIFASALGESITVSWFNIWLLESLAYE